MARFFCQKVVHVHHRRHAYVHYHFARIFNHVPVRAASGESPRPAYEKFSIGADSAMSADVSDDFADIYPACISR